jgi:histidinol dehydrogenase
MLARIDVRGTSGDLRALLARPVDEGPGVAGPVTEIIAAVRERGAEAVRDLTARLDGSDVPDPRVPRDEIISALDRISPGLRAALEVARDQIVAWHEAQRERAARHERLGVEVS